MLFVKFNDEKIILTNGPMIRLSIKVLMFIKF